MSDVIYRDCYTEKIEASCEAVISSGVTYIEFIRCCLSKIDAPFPAKKHVINDPFIV